MREFRFAKTCVIVLAVAAGGTLAWLVVREMLDTPTSVQQSQSAGGAASEAGFTGDALYRDFSKLSLSREDMQKLSELKEIRHLRMPRNTKDEDLELIGGINIERLSLAGSRVSGPGLVHLAKMQDLEMLSLAGTKVDDEGLVYLPQLESITTLNLSGTKITDKGIKLLKEKGLYNLEKLNVEDTPIGDEAMHDIVTFERLGTLNLCGTHVSDASLDEIVKLHELRELECMRTGITAAGIKLLKKKRPALEINATDRSSSI
ncbi:MAG TPA: hypothetical protein VKU82_14165 [Planctomycetaceae bacterium]|nr:hypothetical protein [Planctomycetaceae bacterium]